MPKLKQNCSPRNIWTISVWEIIDLTLSQRNNCRLKELIQQYNAGCPTTTITDALGRQRTYVSGEIKTTQRAVLSELMYLCLQQLEEMRVSGNDIDRMRYEIYLAGDRLPVVTNRGKLSRKLKANLSKISKSSVYNHLNTLQQAGIILAKRNNGRGDFRLFLSKEIFAFREAYRHIARMGVMGVDSVQKTVEKAENPVEEEVPQEDQGTKPAAVTAIEPQQLGALLSQILPQSISINFKTKEIINNKGGKSGVSARQQEHDPGLQPEPEKLERRSITPKIVAAGGGENAAPAVENAAVSPAQERLQRYGMHIKSKQELSRQVAQLLPGKERPFYLKLLQIQYIALLYPSIDRFHLKCIQRDLMRLLNVYFDLIPTQDTKDAFRQLSRAIEMVYQYKQKHPDYRLYDPLSFLRTDYSGGFREVIDKWLPEEEARRRLRADKREDLLMWQKGMAHVDNLFAGVIEALRTELYQSRDVFKSAALQLGNFLTCNEATEATKNRVLGAFKERCLHIYRELIQEAREREDIELDPTWRTFLKYCKLQETKE